MEERRITEEKGGGGGGETRKVPQGTLVRFKSWSDMGRLIVPQYAPRRQRLPRAELKWMNLKKVPYNLQYSSNS
jgi:hypothetical protein